MASNNLATILDDAKITANQLAANCTLANSTVKSVYMKKRTPAPTTQERLVKGLNRLTKKSLTVADVFPA
jgi:hypothetical protein